MNEEEAIWNMVHQWCGEQRCEIPDWNRRVLMERIAALRQPRVIESLPEHECRYCGVMTHQPDEECYRAPEQSGNVL
jgi:hypothetical protein